MMTVLALALLIAPSASGMHIADSARELASALESARGHECPGENVPWLQIGIAMDCTGSTGAYLASLKETTGVLAHDLADKVTKLEMAFLCYRDIGDTDPPRFQWAVHPGADEHWFSDATELQEAIKTFHSAGGGDAPEDNAGAMGEMLHEKPWGGSAVKILLVVSKDRDSFVGDLTTDALQCDLMKDLRAEGLHLVLGHLDNDPTHSMMFDSPKWTKCYNDVTWKIKEVYFPDASVDAFGTAVFDEVCEVIETPAPTPAPAKAVADVCVTGTQGSLNGEYRFLSDSSLYCKAGGTVVIRQGDGGWNFCPATGCAVTGACGGSRGRMGHVGNCEGSSPCPGSIYDWGNSKDSSIVDCPAPSPSPSAQVTGDPHVTNLDGVRFNIIRSGTHQLLRLPRQTSADQAEPLLQVLGKVDDQHTCAEAYVKEIAMSGTWLADAGQLLFRSGGDSLDDADAIELQINGTRLSADDLKGNHRFARLMEVLIPRKRHKQNSHEKITRAHLLTIKVHLPDVATLTIDWVHRMVPGGSTTNHMNFAASGLPRSVDIGGILGHDDHTEAATRDPGCKVRSNGELLAMPWTPQVIAASHKEQA